MLKKIAIVAVAVALTGCGGGGGGGGSGAPASTGGTPGGSGGALPVLASSGTLVNASAGVTPAWVDGSTSSGGKGATIGGVECLTAETYHLHAHLTIIKDGVTQRVPAQIGLTGCAYELHTHDYTGVIHVETSAAKKFTLGQFFSVWGQPLSATNVAGLSGASVRFFISDAGNLVEYTGDPTAIEITQHRSIYIVIGTVPATLPKDEWPATL